MATERTRLSHPRPVPHRPQPERTAHHPHHREDSDCRMLAAEQFSGREAVNELFCFDVDALTPRPTSTSTNSSAKSSPSACCSPTAAAAPGMGCVPGLPGWAPMAACRYRLRLEPALALLARAATATSSRTRTYATSSPNCWPIIRGRLRLRHQAGPAKRAICTQYREATSHSSRACWHPKA